jgi:hypothetical protein
VDDQRGNKKLDSVGKKVKSSHTSHNRSNDRSCLPIPWSDIPHEELWQKSLHALESGSQGRASEDSLRHILRRRLPLLAPADHHRYIELECHRMVETLRIVRDQYRTYLENEGCKPVAEMYWVVFRFGMIPYAVKVLRSTASDYVVSSRVLPPDWQILYCYSEGIVPLELSSPKQAQMSEYEWRQSVQNTMVGLIREETFDLVVTGGPFGREGQVLLSRQRPSEEFHTGEMTLMESIETRQKLWDACRPWTEGLATLFDVLQEELLLQAELLPQDGRRAEENFTSLSRLEKLAYQYIIGIGRQRSPRSLGAPIWKSLLSELDREKIPLDRELKGRSKDVLNAVRRRGYKISSWSECYDSKLRASLESGGMHILKREVMHFLHNAAKRAAYHLSKVWRP